MEVTVTRLQRTTRCCALLLGLSWTSGAAAQVKHLSDTKQGYKVEFDDSDLLGDQLGVTGFVLRIRSTPARVLLIRPRASFVSELTKSVEDM